MIKRHLAAVLAVTLLLGIFAGCDSPRPEAFSGENDISMSLGDRFTINSSSDDEKYRHYKYVVCEVTLEVGNKGAVKTLEQRLHRVRGIVTDTIGAKTFDELSTAEQREALKLEIQTAINEEFNNTSSVQRVVFNDFYFAAG
jgi:flagellar basal body-associated protein FliL